MARRQPTPTFHAFTIKYDGRVNRIVTELAVFPAFDVANPPVPALEGYLTSGLWDTGATMSLIDPQVAAQLNLSPTGATRLTRVGGSDPCNTYVVNLGLPNKVVVAGVQVAEGIIGNGVGAIIGMDVISQSDFSITNVDGLSRMTFRHPSVTTIDYVAEANRIVYAGVNRNAPCPCGRMVNGKPVKFKNCHGQTSR